MAISESDNQRCELSIRDVKIRQAQKCNHLDSIVTIKKYDRNPKAHRISEIFIPESKQSTKIYEESLVRKKKCLTAIFNI